MQLREWQSGTKWPAEGTGASRERFLEMITFIWNVQAYFGKKN